MHFLHTFYVVVPTSSDLEQESRSREVSEEDKKSPEKTSQLADAVQPLLSSINDRHVPHKSFQFPKRRFGNNDKKRACQHSWFERFTWLHYLVETDSVICAICWIANNKSE